MSDDATTQPSVFSECGAMAPEWVVVLLSTVQG
jgi:hypothetical protein